MEDWAQLRRFLGHHRPETIERVSHELWGRVQAPETLDDLFLILGQLARLNITAWRGQADATWALDSSLVRRLRLDEPHRSLHEGYVREVEEMLIERARRAGFGSDVGELELLARLQHHGAATRLIDLTRSAMTACWFACHDPDRRDTDGILLGFPLSENAAWLRTREMHLTVPELIEKAGPMGMWWEPRGLSPRIPAQQAVFLLSAYAENRCGTVATGMEVLGVDDVGNVPGAAAILLTSAFKRQLLAVAPSVLGISEESLFPDFDGFARAHAVDRPLPMDFLERHRTLKFMPA